MNSISGYPTVLIVGRTNVGKSTLFKLILGSVHADGGNVTLTGRMKVATVAQETPGGEQTPLEFVLSSHREMDALLKEAETCEDPERIGEIHARLAEIDAYTAEARAAQILAGLGYDHEQQNQPLSRFSGGWRMRVALAAALFQEPDLLLLDEPTNNLDKAGIEHLTQFLINYKKTCLVISHDAEFLNAFTHGVLYLDVRTQKMEQYVGNYTDVVKDISARIEKENRANALLQKEIQRNKDQANVFSHKGGNMRALAKRMREKAADMEEEVRQDVGEEEGLAGEDAGAQARRRLSPVPIA